MRSEKCIVGLYLIMALFLWPVGAQDVSKSPISTGLMQQLKEPSLRKEAMREIKKQGDIMLPVLRRLAHDRKEKPEHRIVAHKAIGAAGTVEARNELEKCLFKDRDPFDRAASAAALGSMEQREAIPILKKAARDPSANVRMNAVWALAKLGDTSEKEAALDALGSTDPSESRLAVHALEAIGDKTMIPRIRKLSENNSDYMVQAHAKMVAAALESLEMNEQERINYWTDQLRDPDYFFQKFAAEELAKIAYPEEGSGNQEALNRLETIGKDRNHPGCRAALKELSKLIEAKKLGVDPMEYWKKFEGGH